ncbi:MAG TPA: TonB-dependent receptor, partial [Terriglobales bacterium]
MITPRSLRLLFPPRKMVLLILLVAMFVFSRSWAVGQSASATLSGTVEDQSGAVIPNASVTIENVATSLRRQTTTNGDGYFTLPLLPPAKYTLRIESQGFSPVQVNDVVLNVGDNRALQIQLKAGDVNAQVTIDSDAEAIRTDGSVGTVINRTQVASMPLNGRSLQALIQLVPGVVLTSVSAGGAGGATSGAQFSVNGQRTTSNYFTVDGVGANTGIVATLQGNAGQSAYGTGLGTTALGGTNSIASLDALQEFRVETSSYAPEFGRTSGGQVTLVTRSGTNNLTGSASYYFRNEALDANNWFANANKQPRPAERQSLFSGVLGGPVYFPSFGEAGRRLWSGRDRLFFFFSYEGLRLEQPQSKVVTVPSLSLRVQAPAALKPYLNAFPIPNGQDFGDGTAQFAGSWSDPASFNVFGFRIDGKVTNNLTGFFRYNHAPSNNAQRKESLSEHFYSDVLNDSYTGGATWVAGKRLTTDVRVNWTDNRVSLYSALDNFGGAVVPSTDIFPRGYSPSNENLAFALGDSSWSWGAAAINVQRQFNVVSTSNYLFRSHQLKFGIDYRRLLPVFGEGGAANNTEAFVFDSQADILSGSMSGYQVSSSIPTPLRVIIPSLSLFAQDAWRATSRLTLTYGVRFEHVPSPDEANGRLPYVLTGLETSPPKNVQLAPVGTPLMRARFGYFAPRLGIAYQLSRGSGWESTVRGGVGQFYDLAFGGVFNAFQLTPPFGIFQFPDGGPFPLSPNRTLPDPTKTPPGSLTQTDPNLKLPYTIEWNAAWEQGIGKSQTITATYVGARGYRLLGNQNNRVASPFQAGSLFLTVVRNLSESRYDALQLQFNRRLSRRLQALASYSFGRSRDTLSDNIGLPVPASVTGPLVPAWGASSFDVRHVFSSAVSYDLPRFTRTAVLSELINGWGTDLLIRYQSAPPYNPTITAVNVVQGATYTSIQPNLIPGVPIYVDDPTVP